MKTVRLLITIFVIGLIFTSTSNVIAESYVYGPDGDIQEATYVVTRTNETASYYWWDSTTNRLIKYIVPLNSLFNVSFITDGNPPNVGNEPLLDLEIGNLTMSNITDVSVESNLALGYWTVSQNGLITNTNITLLKEKFDSLLPNTTSYSLDELVLSYLGGNIAVIILSIQDAFQKTNLIYDKSTGLILSANVTAGNFILDFTIYSINRNCYFYASSTTTKFTPFIFQLFSFSLILTIIIKRRYY